VVQPVAVQPLQPAPVPHAAPVLDAPPPRLRTVSAVDSAPTAPPLSPPLSG
jgi:hypothetical protein